MNTPGSSFRSHSLNSRIARLANSQMSDSMLKNAGISKKSSRSLSDSKKGFIKIEQYLLKKRIISEISTSQVIDGTLIDRDDDGVHVRVDTIYNLDNTLTSCTETAFESIHSSLDIVSICLFDEIESNNLDKKLYTKQFKIGSFVKGVIIKVDYHTLDIYITTLSTHSPHPYHVLGLSHKHKSHKNTHKNSAVTSPYYQHRYSAPTSPFQLQLQSPFKPSSLTRSQSSGSSSTSNEYNRYYRPIAQSPLYAAFDNKMHNKVIPQNEFDLLQSVGNNMSHLSNLTAEYHRLWIDRVRNNELFRNPAGVDMMRDAFGINDSSSIIFRKPNLCRNILSKSIKNELSKRSNNNNDNKDIIGNDECEIIQFDKGYLRKEQAFLSSRYALESGVNHARNNRLDKAIKHYNVALEWDSKYSDAMVAKAAALTHQNKLVQAEKCVTEAIEIDPNTPNAQKFLHVILQKKKEDCFAPNSMSTKKELLLTTHTDGIINENDTDSLNCCSHSRVV